MPCAAPMIEPASAAIESESPAGHRGARQGRDRIVREQQYAVQRRRQRLLGDPAAPVARHGSATRSGCCQGWVEAIEHLQAVVPAAGDPLWPDPAPACASRDRRASRRDRSPAATRQRSRSRAGRSISGVPSSAQRTANMVNSLAASAVGCPWVIAACNWAAPARSSSPRPRGRAIGVTRMFAPQPFEPITVASQPDCRPRPVPRTRSGRSCPARDCCPGVRHQSRNRRAHPAVRTGPAAARRIQAASSRRRPRAPSGCRR